ncbi:hypothetical protein ROA7745_03596 [Roseovarius aestuarii]|uniref:DUF3987 domain-containing protein n=2 Tax=Roseovarius aestuarii TaxID=475083 RepID=A0A1X7BVS4_9RHOB|nr:hypothetical protein ROA7745_03596 [Roseovarius aestuarii]
MTVYAQVDAAFRENGMTIGLNGHGAQPEGPQPLIRETPPGQPYPSDALGPLKGAVKAVHASTGAPLAIPAQSALSVASLAVQGFANVETLAGFSPTSLYALTIARSGERKSSCDRQFMLALREHEREREADRREAMTTWQNDVALWRQSRDAITGGMKKKGSDRNAARVDLADLGGEPPAPPSQSRTATEPTFEGLTKLFIEGQPSQGLFSDEGGQFLGGHGMNSDNKQKTLAGLNSLWDGSPIRRTRAGDGATTLYGKRLALHLMVQPEVAQGVMSDALAGGIGFLPRCLICEPTSTIGTRLSSVLRFDTAPIDAFAARLSAILTRTMPMRDPDTRELEPRDLHLSSAARNMLIEFSDHVEREQAHGGEFHSITGYASKAQEQAARIAGVLTLWADLDAPEVQPDTMANAITLAEFYLSEAARLVDGAIIPPDIAQAEKLRRWLVDSWHEPAVLPGDILQFGPNSLRNRKAAGQAISTLVQAGWLVPLNAGTVVRGKSRREAYSVQKGG